MSFITNQVDKVLKSIYEFIQSMLQRKQGSLSFFQIFKDALKDKDNEAKISIQKGRYFKEDLEEIEMG